MTHAPPRGYSQLRFFSAPVRQVRMTVCVAACVDRTKVMTLSIEDRLDIHELLSLHGHLPDDCSASDLGLLLTDDAEYDITAYGLGVVSGLAALIELFSAR